MAPIVDGRGGAGLKLGVCSFGNSTYIYKRLLYARHRRDGRLLPSRSLSSGGRRKPGDRDVRCQSRRETKQSKGVESDGGCSFTCIF